MTQLRYLLVGCIQLSGVRFMESRVIDDPVNDVNNEEQLGADGTLIDGTLIGSGYSSDASNSNSESQKLRKTQGKQDSTFLEHEKHLEQQLEKEHQKTLLEHQKQSHHIKETYEVLETVQTREGKKHEVKFFKKKKQALLKEFYKTGKVFEKTREKTGETTKTETKLQHLFHHRTQHYVGYHQSQKLGTKYRLEPARDANGNIPVFEEMSPQIVTDGDNPNNMPTKLIINPNSNFRDYCTVKNVMGENFDNISTDITTKPHMEIDTATLPAQFYDYVFLSKVRNQHIPRYCGSCLYHGAVSALSDRIRIAKGINNGEVELSIQQILDCGVGQGTSCCGGWTTDTYTYLFNTGSDSNPDKNLNRRWLALEDTTPYMACSVNVANVYCALEKSDKNGELQKRRVCHEPDPKFYRHAYTVSALGVVEGKADIKRELHKNGPLACSVCADVFEGYKGGIITRDDVPGADSSIGSIGNRGCNPGDTCGCACSENWDDDEPDPTGKNRSSIDNQQNRQNDGVKPTNQELAYGDLIPESSSSSCGCTCQSGWACGSYTCRYNHVVTIQGWGRKEVKQKNGKTRLVDYWIGKNSWGQYWGEMGYFKIEIEHPIASLETECAWATPDWVGKAFETGKHDELRVVDADKSSKKEQPKIREDDNKKVGIPKPEDDNTSADRGKSIITKDTTFSATEDGKARTTDKKSPHHESRSQSGRESTKHQFRGRALHDDNVATSVRDHGQAVHRHTSTRSLHVKEDDIAMQQADKRGRAGEEHPHLDHALDALDAIGSGEMNTLGGMNTQEAESFMEAQSSIEADKSPDTKGAAPEPKHADDGEAKNANDGGDPVAKVRPKILARAVTSEPAYDSSDVVALSPVKNQFIPSGKGTNKCFSDWIMSPLSVVEDRIRLAEHNYRKSKQLSIEFPASPIATITLSTQHILDCIDTNIGNCDGGKIEEAHKEVLNAIKGPTGHVAFESSNTYLACDTDPVKAALNKKPNGQLCNNLHKLLKGEPAAEELSCRHINIARTCDMPETKGHQYCFSVPHYPYASIHDTAEITANANSLKAEIKKSGPVVCMLNYRNGKRPNYINRPMTSRERKTPRSFIEKNDGISSFPGNNDSPASLLGARKMVEVWGDEMQKESMDPEPGGEQGRSGNIIQDDTGGSFIESKSGVPNPLSPDLTLPYRLNPDDDGEYWSNGNMYVAVTGWTTFDPDSADATAADKGLFFRARSAFGSNWGRLSGYLHVRAEELRKCYAPIVENENNAIAAGEAAAEAAAPDGRTPNNNFNAYWTNQYSNQLATTDDKNVPCYTYGTCFPKEGQVMPPLMKYTYGGGTIKEEAKKKSEAVDLDAQ